MKHPKFGLTLALDAANLNQNVRAHPQQEQVSDWNNIYKADHLAIPCCQ